MSISRTLCLAISAILIPGGAVTAATVTYDGGTTSRPVSVVGIGINSSFYDVTFTYNNNGATNPLRVGILPDTDIALGRAGLLSLLNTQSVESRYSALHFQPNVGYLDVDTGNYEIQGFLSEIAVGSNDWQEFPGAVVATAEFAGDQQGFAQFAPSIVPEPSAIAGCLGLVGMGLLIGWRRKSNRKKK